MKRLLPVGGALALFLLYASDGWGSGGVKLTDSKDEWLKGSSSSIDYWTLPGWVRPYRLARGSDFASSTLDSWWAWEAVPPASYSLTDSPGTLRIKTYAPPGTEWRNTTDTAPKLCQVVGGDFRMETGTWPGPLHSSFSGIYVRQDSRNYIQLGYTQDDSGGTGGTKITARLTNNGVTTEYPEIPHGEVGADKWYFPSYGYTCTHANCCENWGQIAIEKAGSQVFLQAFHTNFYDCSPCCETGWTTFQTITPSYDHYEIGFFYYDTATNSYKDVDSISISQGSPPPLSAPYTSTIFDFGTTPVLDGVVSWAQSASAGASVEVRTRSSASWDDLVNGVPSWSSPYATPGGSVITGGKERYIQYMLVLNGTASGTPYVDWVKIVYPVSYTFTSTAIDLGTTPQVDGTISWSQTVPGGTSVVMRTRTSDDGSTWDAYSSAYATPEGSTITSTRRRYVQYQYVVSGSVTATPSVGSVSIIYPGVQPMAPILSSTTHVDGVWGNAPTVWLGWEEPIENTGHVWDWWYALDANVLSGTVIVGSAMSLANTISGTELVSLPEGRHSWQLVARGDPLGYPASPESVYVIKKDTRKPGLTTITSPTHPNTSENTSPSPVFVLSAVDDTSATVIVSGIAGYHHVLDQKPGTQPGLGSSFTTDSQVSFTGVENGTWWFHARAKDVAGNLGNVGHYQITVLSMEVLVERKVHAIPSPVRGGKGVIQYDLAAPVRSVKIEVLNESGKRVASMEGTTSQGVNRVDWDTKNLANGVYILRFKVRRQDGKDLTVLKKVGVVR